jgi:hypothetical protein
MGITLWDRGIVVPPIMELIALMMMKVAITWSAEMLK